MQSCPISFRTTLGMCGRHSKPSRMLLDTTATVYRAYPANLDLGRGGGASPRQFCCNLEYGESGDWCKLEESLLQEIILILFAYR